MLIIITWFDVTQRNFICSIFQIRNTNMTISRQLVLNLSQVRSNHKDVKVKIGKLDFDDDKLKKLRGSHFETHVFRREGDTILCVPYKSNAADIGDYFEDVSLGSPYLRA